MATAADDGIGRLWLLGSMGAGKSAVGWALAQRLGVPLIDNDVELTSRTGRSAADLATAPDGRLHEREAEQLRSAAAGPPPFVAGVAASVADRPGDLAVLRETGRVVYLRVPVAILARRVAADPRRPWLGSDPQQWLAAQLARREPAYVAAADLVVDAGEGTPAELAARIARNLLLLKG